MTYTPTDEQIDALARDDYYVAAPLVGIADPDYDKWDGADRHKVAVAGLAETPSFKAIIRSAERAALGRAIQAHRDMHRVYGSTSTCRGGIGGAAMTAHCAHICQNHGAHTAENDAWRAIERDYFNDKETP